MSVACPGPGIHPDAAWLLRQQLASTDQVQRLVAALSAPGPSPEKLMLAHQRAARRADYARVEQARRDARKARILRRVA